MFARLAINTAGYAKLTADPAAPPVAVPVVESIADHARVEIADVMGHGLTSPSAKP
jgi:hypothetical protein